MAPQTKNPATRGNVGGARNAISLAAIRSEFSAPAPKNLNRRRRNPRLDAPNKGGAL
jgi:hypothetical protein